MGFRQLTFCLTTLFFLLPNIAQAGDIYVNTGNVRINTNLDGNIDVRTGRSRVAVPSRRSNVYHNCSRSFNYHHYRCTPNRYIPQNHCYRGRNTYSYQSTNVSRSGQSVSQRSISTICR